MRNIATIFLKQLKETLKNKSVLIQFLMFPVMTIVMGNVITIDGMPEHFLVKLFAVMFVGMSPLTCISSIISEEKEKNTLRVLVMCNVKPFEYLLGIGIYVYLMCMIGTAVFAVCGDFSGVELVQFLAVMSFGIVISGLVGAVIGIFSKNQMTATSVTVPVMMIFSFLPMLAMFNEKIEKIAELTYTQHLSIIINGLGSTDIGGKSLVVLTVDFAVAFLVFGIMFRKRGLE